MRDLRVNREKTKTVFVTVGLAALVILVPLAFTSQGILASATRQSAGQRVTESWLSDQPGLEVMRLSVEGEDVAVRVSGEGSLPSVEDLEVQLEEELESNVTVLVEYFPSVIVSSDSQ
jgi:flagellar biosynthesis component FlhA